MTEPSSEPARLDPGADVDIAVDDDTAQEIEDGAQPPTATQVNDPDNLVAPQEIGGE